MVHLRGFQCAAAACLLLAVQEVELEEGPLGEAEPLRQSWRDVVLEREERGGSGRATPEGEYGRVDRCG